MCNVLAISTTSELIISVGESGVRNRGRTSQVMRRQKCNNLQDLNRQTSIHHKVRYINNNIVGLEHKCHCNDLELAQSNSTYHYFVSPAE